MLSFNNLLDIKITKKLTILFITVTLSFIAIAVTYWVVIKNERNATERSNLYVEYGQLVSNAQKNYFKVRRYEKDFLLSISASTGQTYNNAPLDEHAKYISNLEQNMEQLRVLSNTSEFNASEKLMINGVELPAEYQSQLVDQASLVVDDYKLSFLDIVKFNRVVGFDGSEGLRHKAEVLLTNIDNSIGSTLANKSQPIIAKIKANESHILQSTDLTESYENLKFQFQKLYELLWSSEYTAELYNPKLDEYMKDYIGTIDEIVSNKRNANEYTELYDFMLGPILDEMGQSSALSIYQNQAIQKSKTNKIAGIVALLLIAIASIISLLLYMFGYTITKPINTLVDVIHKVNDGDLLARTHLARKDELGELSIAFDRLLDEKVTQLSISEKNNDALNESIISLLGSVAQLSKKDFTITAPVFEDVTGALGDSLNYLTKETAGALSDVKEISVRVVVESNRVQRASKFVMAVAEKERRQVESIMDELKKSSNEMNKMSEYTARVNEKADYALRNTQSALEKVDRSVADINGIRETIRETEEKIKRLGERSQEITGIVNLVNTIAERTHIFALNASMHAASSGEKGRGFSVVADEVQRLAENAREATKEIDLLVNNIRIETKDAATVMNNTISQVTDGTAHAEEAESAMRETQDSTEDLVKAVNQITKSSKLQADANLALVQNANEILTSTTKTEQQLQQQMTNTNNLVRYSNMLLTTVGVFKLPVIEQEDKLAIITAEENKNRKTVPIITKTVNKTPSKTANKKELEIA